MRYNDENIEKFIAELKIVDVVGDVVKLSKFGADYRGLCPFHSDSKPSFNVSVKKNIAKCFACGEGGNPLSFYMKYHKVDFKTAINDLSKKYSIKTDIKISNNNEDKNKNLYIIMEEALKFYKANLFNNKGKEALEYLIKRGFNVDFIEKENLGYALNSWDELLIHLNQLGYKNSELESLGLIKKGDKNYYDTFRNRIIFPIYSITNKIIGFGGRTLSKDDKTAKYLNSPETVIFKKGENLYNLVNRGSEVRNRSYAILMEGYVDVLAAKSHGFDVALASLGTAFTEDQAKLLKRYTDNVIISYDMDLPGRKATLKTALLLKKYGFNIRVLEYQEAKDPDDFLKKFGRDGFLKAIKESREIYDFIFAYYAKEYDLDDFLGKQNFIKKFKEFFDNIDNELERSLYFDKLSQDVNIDKNVIADEILDKKNKKSDKIVNNNHNIYNKRKKTEKSFIEALDKLELETLTLICSDKELLEKFKMKKFSDGFLKKVLEKILLGLEIKNIVESDEFSLDEQSTLLEIITKSFVYSDLKRKDEQEFIIFKDWFKRELDQSIELCKMISGIEKIKKLMEYKSISSELQMEIDYKKVELLYEKYLDLRL